MTTTRIFSWKYGPKGKIKITHKQNTRGDYLPQLEIQDSGQIIPNQTYNPIEGANHSPEYTKSLVFPVRELVRNQKDMTPHEIQLAISKRILTTWKPLELKVEENV